MKIMATLPLPYIISKILVALSIFHFWICQLFTLEITKSWSTNNTKSGQTAQKCRLAWLYTGGKGLSLFGRGLILKNHQPWQVNYTILSSIFNKGNRKKIEIKLISLFWFTFCLSNNTSTRTLVALVWNFHNSL